MEGLRNKSLLMNALNVNSNAFHAVEDAFSTGCGCEYRNLREYKFSSQPPNPDSTDYHMCEKAGCVKLFETFAKAL